MSDCHLMILPQDEYCFLKEALIKIHDEFMEGHQQLLELGVRSQRCRKLFYVILTKEEQREPKWDKSNILAIEPIEHEDEYMLELNPDQVQYLYDAVHKPNTCPVVRRYTKRD